MRILLISLGMVIAISSTVLSQNLRPQQYRTAIGLKGMWSSTNDGAGFIGVKHFFNSPHAIDAHLGFGRDFIWLQTNYNHNFRITNALDWYAGGGVDLGYWNRSYLRERNLDYQGIWTGVNGLVGLEYTIPHLPVNFALDVGPTLRLAPEIKWGVNIGFAMRYAIK